MKTMRTVILGTVAGLVVVASVSAQEPINIFERRVASNDTQQVVLDKVKAEQAWKVALETKAVANAPYSAETVNESVQQLPDGNRIVNRSTSRVYRDSAGRVRRETLDANGDLLLTSLSDPATGVSYVIDAKSNMVGQARSVVRYAPGNEKVVTTEAIAGVAPRAGEPVTLILSASDKQKAEAERSMVVVREGVVGSVTAGAGEGRFVFATAKGDTTKEDLGQQTIEGLAATGTRTTTTIPAGAIGNDLPIKIVSEEWFSPDLQVLVLTRHSDPRTGETTYRLTNVNRSEPPKSLFDPPAGKARD